jgi:hypothetical protein
LQDTPKFTQKGIIGLKMHHLAALIQKQNALNLHSFVGTLQHGKRRGVFVGGAEYKRPLSQTRF